MLNKRNLKSIFFSFLYVFFLFHTHSFAQKENYEYLINAQSLNGYTGNIITPSPYTTGDGKFSLGLHRFNVGINYGIAPSWETGIKFNLTELTQQGISTSTVILHAKYHISKQYFHPKKCFFDFSVGFYQKTLYFIAGKQFPEFFDIVIQPGIDIDIVEEKAGYFVCVAKSIRYSYFLVDYKSQTGQTNLGWRVLLSPTVKLDLFLINIDKIKNVFDNFVFGLTLVS